MWYTGVADFVGNSGVARCDLIRALRWLCVKCADAVGAGVMFEAERLAALCFVWCVVTSGRSVVHRSRRLRVGNSCVTRCGLIRALRWLCVKCADAVGAGVMFEAGAFYGAHVGWGVLVEMG